MSVEIQTEERDGIAIVSLAGELDLPGSMKAAGELAIAEEKEPEVLVLDLRDLDFIDSSGIQMIVTADQRARRSGRRLALVRGPDQVHRVFTMMRLDEELELVEDLSQLP